MWILIPNMERFTEFSPSEYEGREDVRQMYPGPTQGIELRAGDKGYMEAESNAIRKHI